MGEKQAQARETRRGRHQPGEERPDGKGRGRDGHGALDLDKGGHRVPSHEQTWCCLPRQEGPAAPEPFLGTPNLPGCRCGRAQAPGPLGEGGHLAWGPEIPGRRRQHWGGGGGHRAGQAQHRPELWLPCDGRGGLDGGLRKRGLPEGQAPLLPTRGEAVPPHLPPHCRGRVTGMLHPRPSEQTKGQRVPQPVASLASPVLHPAWLTDNQLGSRRPKVGGPRPRVSLPLAPRFQRECALLAFRMPGGQGRTPWGLGPTAKGCQPLRPGERGCAGPGRTAGRPGPGDLLQAPKCFLEASSGCKPSPPAFPGAMR